MTTYIDHRPEPPRVFFINRMTTGERALLQVFRGVAMHFPARVLSWMMAFITLNLGFILIDKTELFHQDAIFVYLSRVGPQQMWGVLCLTIGVVRVLALIINGSFPSFRYSPHIRAATAVLACFVWFQLSLGFYFTDRVNLGIAVFPYLLVFDIYNAYVCAEEAGRHLREWDIDPALN